MRNADLSSPFHAIDAPLIRRFFDARTRERGIVYAAEGRVLSLRVLDQAGRIEAQVAGSEEEPYEVTIWVSRNRRDEVVLATACSCPVGDSCKHAVAALHCAIFGRGEAPPATIRGPQPDPRVDAWLSDLGKARESVVEGPESLIYTLGVDQHRALTITLGVARRKKDGSLGSLRALQAENAALSPGRYMRADDVLATRLIAGIGQVPSRAIRRRLHEEGLAVALRTGRAFWSAETIPLRPGPQRTGTLAWRADDDGTQRPQVIVDGAPATFFVVSGPWYVETTTGTVGLLDIGLEPELAAKVLAAPPLRDVDAAVASDVLRRLGVAPPRTMLATRVITEPPVIHLLLEARAPRYAGSGYRPQANAMIAVAQLGFHYGQQRCAPGMGPDEFRDASAEELVVRRRAREAEDAAVAQLVQLGLLRFGGQLAEQIRAGTGTFGFPQSAGEDAWARFLLNNLPRLREAGWQIEVADDFPEHVVLSDDPWDVDVAASSVTSQLFDVDISVEVEGRRVPLVPIILEGLRRSPTLLSSEGAAIVGRLPDGRRLALPAERLRAVVATLVELFDPHRAKTERIPLARAVSLAALDGALRLRGSGAERLRSAAAALAAPPAPVVRVPSTLRAELRPYQHEGLDWLQRLRAHGFGGILADSMGLGKTLQTLAHLLTEKKARRLDRPALVIAPTSVLPNWQSEAARFAPSLRTLVLHGPRRADRFGEIGDADLVVTSYALLSRDEEVLANQQWHIAILDEAQNIKNPTAKITQIAHRLQANQRLALTGTPIENHLGELWSLFAYVDPGVLGERTRFNRTFRTPIEKGDDTERRAALAARIAPFVLRRTKESVARDLPAKTEIVRPIALGTAQRDLYETIRAAMHERVRAAIAKRGLAKSRIVVLDALLKLRQVCCDPRLLDHPPARAVGAGAKIEALMEMIRELREDGRRILLFSQFTSMLALIEEELRREEIAYELLTGRTKDRAAPVRRFQAGEVPLFLISLKAGGTGLNLTAADTVIHYDPWWNPAVERQATDRAHRIGQHQPVFVYKLVCEQTIEQRILELQARKGALADALLDGDAARLPLDDDEIANLFA